MISIKKKNIAIIIQARTQSTRLKNKVLKFLDNKKLLEWVIIRCKLSNVKNIILAIPSSKNKKLKDIAKKHDIFFAEGSENNVLGRYLKAAKKFNIDVIIRVCSDNPFVDANEIKNLIKDYKKNYKKFDYFFNHRNYKYNFYANGFGAELIETEKLKAISKKKLNKSEIEHVTQYLWNNKAKFKFRPCLTNILKKFNSIRLDIDTKEDYLIIKNLIKTKKIKTNFTANKILKLTSTMIKKCKCDI